MSLHHPALTLSGKKKGKHKWPSAEAKREAEKLEREWEALKAKHGEGKRMQTLRNKDIQVPSTPNRPSAPSIPSLDTGWVPCTKKEPMQYTGTKMRGIATMHKSNAVPVFTDQEAVDISNMRR